MICPACEAGEWKARRVLPRLDVRTCRGCGLLASDIDAPQSVSYAHFDDETYDAAIGRLRRRQTAEVLRFVQRHVARGEWLDVGCGPGYLLAEAAAVGFAVRGIEPDANAAARARTLVGDRVREGLFSKAEEQRADVISTLDVLEHIAPAELPDFVDAVRASLRDDGAWVIKVPSTEGSYFRLAHSLGITSAIERLWQIGYASPHTVYFAKESLTRLLTRHGFRVAASQYVQELPVSSAVPRLTLSGALSHRFAMLALPAVAAINAIDALRRKSDSLMVIARPAG